MKKILLAILMLIIAFLAIADDGNISNPGCAIESRLSVADESADIANNEENQI